MASGPEILFPIHHHSTKWDSLRSENCTDEWAIHLSATSPEGEASLTLGFHQNGLLRVFYVLTEFTTVFDAFCLALILREQIADGTLHFWAPSFWTNSGVVVLRHFVRYAGFARPDGLVHYDGVGPRMKCSEECLKLDLTDAYQSFVLKTIGLTPDNRTADNRTARDDLLICVDTIRHIASAFQSTEHARKCSISDLEGLVDDRCFRYLLRYGPARSPDQSTQLVYQFLHHIGADRCISFIDAQHSHQSREPNSPISSNASTHVPSVKELDTEWVYVLVEAPGDLIKIGRTREANPLRRVQRHKTSSSQGRHLDLVCIFQGPVGLEQQVHAAFEAYRVPWAPKREWFLNQGTLAEAVGDGFRCFVEERSLSFFSPSANQSPKIHQPLSDDQYLASIEQRVRERFVCTR